jgi:peptidoglycan/xylan/chitin deacetylase (PgdA/CDA1 family)
LREVQSRGHEIGNHSQNHRRLTDLTPSEQFDEISAAHERMIGEGIRPRSFCFPYGSHNTATQGALRQAGYQVALALGKRTAEKTDDLLSLPRVVVAYSDSLPMLLYKLTLKPKLRRG